MHNRRVSSAKAVKKPASKKPAAKSNPPPLAAAKAKPAAKEAPAKKAPTKVAAGKPAKGVAKAASASKPMAKRADYGAPIDAFFAKQPEKFLPLLNELRALVERAAPGVESSLKWGMPFFSLNGNMLCGIGAHKAHVNLIFSGPPGTFADPDGLLEGDGETGRRLKITGTEVDDLPRAAIKGWLATAVKRARA